MTGFRKASLILVGSIILTSSWAAAQTEEANNILGQAGPGVIAIIGYGADKAEIIKGSALALGEDVVVTAYHVISQAYDAEGVNIKGKKVKIEGILGVDKAHDIALLKLKGKLQRLRHGSIDNLAADARLFALGSNESGRVVIAEGSFRRAVDIGGGERIFEVSMAAPEQFRGGPLVDINGQLVGMLLVLERNFKFGLPIGALTTIAPTGRSTEFKSQTPEKYFETAEGNAFAARAAVALDELMTARSHLDRVVRINPTDLAAQMLLADICARQRDYRAAVSAYQRAIQLDGSRADAFYGLGAALLKQTQYKEAAEALEKAAALGFAGKELYNDLGTAAEAVQDFAKAASAYERYIALGPAEAWNAYHRLGICRTELKEYDAAIAALLEAQRGQPKDLKVKLSLASAYEKAGQLENAEAVYAAMAEIEPATAITYHRQIFRIYDQAKRYDRAIAPARRIIELEPQNETNHYYLGLAYFNLQRYDEAIAAFQQAVSIKPDFSHAWFQIGSSYINQKKPNDAAAAYKKYAELAPDDPNGWLSIGVSYMQAKNFEAALEFLRRCVGLKPDSGVAQFNLAITYVNLKDNYSAKEIYNKLQTLDPALAERLKKYIR